MLKSGAFIGKMSRFLPLESLFSDKIEADKIEEK